MIELQRLTGMRPGEVCSMPQRVILTTGQVWTYRSESQETEHHGRERTVFPGRRHKRFSSPGSDPISRHPCSALWRQ